jgi:integrase
LGECDPKKIFFKDFAAEYLEYSRANKARSSYERDETVIKKHLVPAWGERLLQRITAKDVENYKLSRIEKVTTSTVNRELDLISNIFHKAVEWGYLKEVPVAQMRKIKTGVQHFRYLAHEETERLLEACQQSPNPQLYVFVVTALNTGMRLGELTELEWKDVDFKRGKHSCGQ